MCVRMCVRVRVFVCASVYGKYCWSIDMEEAMGTGGNQGPKVCSACLRVCHAYVYVCVLVCVWLYGQHCWSIEMEEAMITGGNQGLKACSACVCVKYICMCVVCVRACMVSIIGV